MECVNLKRLFGKRFRVRYEESYYAQYGPNARTDDPWLQIIPCDMGHIYPHGGNMLAASTNKPGPTVRKLKALPGVIVHQDGNDGANILFHIDQFDAVAEIMRPKRRRVASEAERERLRLLSAKYGFKSITGAPETSAVCVGTG